MSYIIFPGVLDVRRGGPSGYIANLKKGLSVVDQKNEVKIISKKGNAETRTPNIKGKSMIRSIFKHSNWFLNKHYENLILKRNNFVNIMNELNNISFNSNDIIHIHNVLEYHLLFKNNISGKTILTPHTPESVADEIINNIKASFNDPTLKLGVLHRKIKEIERDAFKGSDHFIFPSIESMEIFNDFIDGFSDIMKEKKVYFNFTGCDRLNHKLDKMEFRNKYNIPRDAFVISYIGRHNKIKGFDILNQVAKEMFKIDKSIYFVSGGTGDIKAESANFIQIGWTDDPGSIVNASDLFVLPNRSTYFDLVLLEVLSIGTPVLASNTGGNKSVGKLTEGVNLFDNKNVDGLVKEILLLKENYGILSSMKKSNVECFENYFTLEMFGKRYLNILEEIRNT